MSPGRSFDPISEADLRYLRDVAISDVADFAVRHPKHTDLVRRRICVALCQGAALHFLDGANGVKDFDVWSFFEPHPDAPVFPYRRPRHVPFERDGFEASMKKVDLLGRTLPGGTAADPKGSLTAYLARGRTASARFLSEKAVVMLDPIELIGTPIWVLGEPVTASV